MQSIRNQRAEVYRHSELARLLNPASLAIIGVSPTPTALGTATLANLAHYAGRVYAVNPKYREVLGRRCFHSLGELPEVPDCVIISVPQDAVESAVDECVRMGVGGAVIFSAGFAETGMPERVALQERIYAHARKGNVRLIGPNCLGIINFGTGLNAIFNRTIEIKPPGPRAVGIVTQSGAMGAALAQATQQGMAISHMLAAGNSIDVDVADYVSYLAQEPSCSAIACIVEGLAVPGRFAQAAAIAHAKGKPVVVYKLARGDEGAVAALSHTATLAGSDQGYQLLFEQTGTVVVDTFEALLETAAFFARAPSPMAEGIAVVGSSGGICIMAADEAERVGLSLPQPEGKVKEALAEAIPAYGSPRNPCDMTGMGRANPNMQRDCVTAYLSDPAYGALVATHAIAAEYYVPRITALGQLSRQFGKPICVVWTSGALNGVGASELSAEPDVCLFRSMRHCMEALKAWHVRAEKIRQWAQKQAQEAPPSIAGDARERAARMIDASASATLAEGEAKKVLAVYGVRVVEERGVASADQAADSAVAIGFPVVVKVDSPLLPHKTEAGVVRVNLRTAQDVRAAYAAVVANARVALGSAPGMAEPAVLVQPMIEADVEVLVGARIDPLFGPLLTVGMGGIFVELLKDSVTTTLPASRAHIRSMVMSLRGARLLTGFRNRPPIDVDALVDTIARLAALVHDQRDVIAELDVNPLMCSSQAVIAVDALIVRHPTQGAE